MWFRLSGWFLLRLAERRFCGLLFVALKARLRHDEPPRITRDEGGRSGSEAQCGTKARPGDGGVRPPLSRLGRVACERQRFSEKMHPKKSDRFAITIQCEFVSAGVVKG